MAVEQVIALSPGEVAAIMAQLSKRKPHVLTEIERITHTVEALGLSADDLRKLTAKP